MVTNAERLSENVEEYLETIFRITHRSAAPRGGYEQDSTHRSAAPRGGYEQDSTHRSAAPRDDELSHDPTAAAGGAGPKIIEPRMAKTGEIAAELGLSPPSVTEMTKRLKEKGYVEYEPYRGVRLTAKGRAHAQMLLRRHRVVQAFLEQVLGMPKEEAHEWGCRMEHAVPPELERYLYMKLPDKDLKGLSPPRSPEEMGTEVREAPATPHPRRMMHPSPRRQGPAKRGSVPPA